MSEIEGQTPAPQTPGPAPIPPQGASTVPPQPQPTMPPNPMPQPGFVPEPSLTGGLKFGYFALGFLGNLLGVLVAWLINADRHPAIKASAVKWALVGFACTFLIGIFLAVSVAGIFGAIATAAIGGGHYASGLYCY